MWRTCVGQHRWAVTVPMQWYVVVESLITTFCVLISEVHLCWFYPFVFVTQHTDPDYSCAYVTIKTNGHAHCEGYGLTFTCGRGTEIVAIAVKALRSLVVGRKLRDGIYARFGEFWRELTSESQLRWVNRIFHDPPLVLKTIDFIFMCTRRLDRKKESCIWPLQPLSMPCGIYGLVSKINHCGVCSPIWNQK